MKQLPPLRMPFALRGEALVHVSEVDAGRRPECACPGCGAVVVARRGDLKRHHFAHDRGIAACARESALHATAKRLLHAAVEAAIAARRPLTLRWACDLCGEQHERNLVGKAAAVALEHRLGDGLCRPDVLLFNAAGRPIAAVEVVVSHPPEEAARAFYARENIALIEVAPRTEEDLEALRSPAAIAAVAVSVCLLPRCLACGGRLVPQRLYVADEKCGRCKRPMKIAFIAVGEEPPPGWGLLNCAEPEDFTVGQLRLAQKMGWTSGRRYTRGHWVPANACPRCRRFEPLHHLCPAEVGIGAAVGHRCHTCGRES